MPRHWVRREREQAEEESRSASLMVSVAAKDQALREAFAADLGPPELYRQLAEIPRVRAGRLHHAIVPGARRKLPVSKNGIGNAETREAAAAKHGESARREAETTALVSRTEVFATLETTQLDVSSNKKLRFRQSYNIGERHNFPVHFPEEIPAHVFCTAISPCGSFRAVVVRNVKNSSGRGIRGDSGKSGKSEAYPCSIEIYQNNRLLLRYDGTKTHRRIHTKGPFAGISWNAAGTKIAFVAEALVRESTGFYGNGAAVFSGAGEAEREPGSRFEHEEDFGEQLEGLRNPRVFVLDIVSGTAIDACKSVPGFLHCGQPIWAPGSMGSVVVTAYSTKNGAGVDMPRRLGMIYYSTRPSSLLLLELSAAQSYDSHTALTTGADGDYSARDARFSPDGSKLIWLTSPSTDLHGSCLELRVMEWPTLGAGKFTVSPAPRTAVPIVQTPGKDGVGTNCIFNGLYVWGLHLPQRVWLEDSRHVVFPTRSRSRQVLVLIDVVTGSVSELEIPHSITRSHSKDGGSQCCHASLLDVFENKVLWSLSTPTKADTVYLFCFEKCGSIASWSQVTSPPRALNKDVTLAMQSVVCSVGTVAPPVSKDVEYILTTAATRLNHGQSRPGKSPLVLYPHGGPHSGFTGAFDPQVMFLCLSGFSVCRVNYRGSVGFGQTLLESLPGNCGRQDVDDCLLALDAAMESGNFDDERLLLLGGSHGGFLVTHLASQQPKRFRAVAARNPVVNIPANLVGSDIPDWAHVESGTGISVPRDGYYLPSEEHLVLMYRKSPVAFLHRMVTPLLLLLGTQDRRVPMPQSVEYFHMLKAKGVACRLLVYEMDHSLSNAVEPQADAWINIVLWFRRNIADPTQ